MTGKWGRGVGLGLEPTMSCRGWTLTDLSSGAVSGDIGLKLLKPPGTHSTVSPFWQGSIKYTKKG